MMATMNAPRVLRGFAIVAAALSLACVALAWQWQSARAAQARLATVSATGADDAASSALRADDDVPLLIARASALRRAGREDEAVRILQTLAARNDLAMAQALAVRQNLGNALLLLALNANTKDDEDRAMTLVELAKQRYREVLRATPDAWDARHNLDLALRLGPETEPPPPREEPTNVQKIQVDLRGIRGVDLP